MPAALDIGAWRVPSRDEVLEWCDRMQRNLADNDAARERPSILIVRKHLTQIDVFCYLKARFGVPNGFQNFLRRDDSDNIIHWEYHLKSGDVDIHISEADQSLHFVVSEEPFTDEDWRDLILNIKADFRRVARGKSDVLRNLEKWVVFPNKYVHVASVCADLYSEVSENVGDFEQYQATSFESAEEHQAHMELANRLSARATKLYGNCIQLALMTPVVAEAFINMIILMLCKPEVRDDRGALEKFVRSHIHTKLFSLADNCQHFAKPIDENTPGYRQFKRVMDRRNDAIHGNIDPIAERLETVYFEGKRPIYAETGDHIGKLYQTMEPLNR